MSDSFDLEQPEHFTAGAVGPKGQRVFFLQASEAGTVVNLKVEKQQVSALADYLERMLADLPEQADATAETTPALYEPVVANWVVGGLGVAYDERVDRIVLIAEELIVVEDEDENAEPEERPAIARFHLQRGQVVAFIEHARGVVAAGRPPCPFCGRPMDPETGFCACVN